VLVLQVNIHLYNQTLFAYIFKISLILSTEEDYKKMVIGKTGGLFRLAIGLMQSFSESDNKYSVKNFNPLLNLLGLFFQIRDDLLNISDFNYMENKAFCEDLTEGKFSFPIIHAINLYPNDNRVLNILRQRTTDIDIKKYAVRLLKEFGSLGYTKDVLNSLFLEIIELVKNNFDGQENLIQLLYYLNKDVENIKVDDIIT
jgi:geranylgeranyl diphosphate synthase type 3